jgi:amino acid adenylation domain-containing protein
MSDYQPSLPQPALPPHQHMTRAISVKTESGLEVPSPLCIPQRIASEGAARPQAVAISASGEVVTYGELERQSNQLARYLAAAGVGRESLVGLYLKRSPTFIVAALAALKSGAAYLPLDPDSPAERIAFMLQDSGVSAVVTSGNLRDRLPSGPWRVVDTIRDAAEIRLQAAQAPETEIHPEDLAYVIYTSGSTGQPKGVEVTHASLDNLVSWHTHAFRIASADRASFMASLGFDAAVWELWPYLTTGAGVHIPEEGVRNDARALREWFLEQKITVSFAATAMAENLLTLDWPSRTPLRILLTGADSLRLRPSSSLPFTLVNNYGPTEYTVVATSGVVEPGGSKTLPAIGCPIDNTTAHILDAAMHELPPGEAGELYLAGAGLARGYRNRPDLTAQRFVSNPFDGEGSRMYRTGDLARLLPNGEIEFLGRVDEQVKVRGFRIEPNEIAAALKSCPGVQASTVIAREDHGGEKRLVAYIVQMADSSLTAPELRAQLSRRLPDYMIPATFVQVKEIPITMNGKVDRQALPEPTGANTLGEESYIAPRNIVEERLAALITPLLHVDRVGVNDNFFLLGGHSLLGTQLITRISDSFGVNLPLLSLFDHPTLGGMSAEIEQLILAKIEASEDNDLQAAPDSAAEGS